MDGLVGDFILGGEEVCGVEKAEVKCHVKGVWCWG